MFLKLLNYKMYIAIILLVVGMGTYTSFLRMKIESLQTTIALQNVEATKLETQISGLNAQVDSYKKDIESQNRYFKTLLAEMRRSTHALQALRDDFNNIEISFGDIQKAKTPEARKKAKKRIEKYLDNSLINSYNCLMKATGANVDCKE